MTAQPSVAYKILTGPQMESLERDGTFAGSLADLKDGYIHLSTAEQLGETLAKHFAGQQGLVVAEVDLTALDDAVKWEPSRGGALFPHVYADLPMRAILASGPPPRPDDLSSPQS